MGSKGTSTTTGRPEEPSRSRPGRRRRWASLLVAGIVAGGCGGGAQGDEEAFCDGVREHREALESSSGAPLGPGAVGVLRDLALEAPEEIRSDLEDIGDYSTSEDVERSYGEIRRFIQEECDVSLAMDLEAGGPATSEAPRLDAARVMLAEESYEVIPCAGFDGAIVTEIPPDRLVMVVREEGPALRVAAEDELVEGDEFVETEDVDVVEENGRTRYSGNVELDGEEVPVAVTVRDGYELEPCEAGSSAG